VAAIRPALEVADIFRRHGEAFRRSHDEHLGRVDRRVMAAIEACRTPALGGHVEQCSDCGLIRCAYNSCRNRHCPKCQGAAAKEWLAAREADLLPVPYIIYERVHGETLELLDLDPCDVTEAWRELGREIGRLHSRVGYEGAVTSIKDRRQPDPREQISLLTTGAAALETAQGDALQALLDDYHQEPYSKLASLTDRIDAAASLITALT